MNNPHLDQAREWAEDVRRIEAEYGSARPDVLAAAEIIRSLPDHWIDADKLRQIIDFQGTSISEEARKDLESLLTPSLPSLYELVVEQKKNPEEYRWMQAKAFHTGEQGCVTDFNLYAETATVLFPNGVMKNVPWEDITPLPDLPRLEWPAQEPQPEHRPFYVPITISPPTREEEAEVRKQFEEPALPRPEDVPAGEPWLVEFNGRKWVGTRDATDQTGYPWALSRLDGIAIGPAKEVEVTLVSRLVPEDKP